MAKLKQPERKLLALSFQERKPYIKEQILQVLEGKELMDQDIRDRIIKTGLGDVCVLLLELEDEGKIKVIQKDAREYWSLVSK